MRNSARFPTLALGSAQLAMSYGVMNQGGSITRREARDILSVAWRSDIDLIDTAAGYADSEMIIGDESPSDSSFKIVSKLLPGTHVESPTEIKTQVINSLARLRVTCLDSLLVHQASDLLSSSGHKLFDGLRLVRDDGLTRKIGVSVYDPDTLMAILERFSIETVQLPLSVLDQRFMGSGLIPALAAKGIEIHVRSVFLQGGLISDISKLPSQLYPAKASIRRFQQRAKSQNVPLVVAALSYVSNCEGVSRIVVGVDSHQQLRSTVHAFKHAATVDFDGSGLGVDSLDVIDPRQWRMN